MDVENACNHGDTASLCWQREVAAAGLPDGRPQYSTPSRDEPEDVLRAVNPSEVFGGAGPPLGSKGPVAPPTVYRLVYALDAEEAEPAAPDVIAIQLVSLLANVVGTQHSANNGNLSSWESPSAAEPWSSHHCIVGQLPLGLERTDTAADHGASGTLHLTAEEQRLLSQEGMSLPDKLPLTKAEERVLKKVRRKIRNKQSAQDSRRRRKEYMDGLEDRAALCSAQNKDLHKKVEQLEKHNMSLLTQLRHLQSLVTHSVSKGVQTSTCLLIIFISLTLIMLPTLSPFSRRPSADNSQPTGVLSRSILTDFTSSLSDEMLQAAAPGGGQSGVDVDEAKQNLEGIPSNDTPSGNSSAGASARLGKPPRADEM
ncbi:cyclic AMP-responsive element-binding protein 3-like protein 4 [Syngnathus acus]|uniref:cyclic AMP-responsive element-binding protein 3-like protein 4 n=1 Tax=Syngnathus acus TaxID=161584 RepID=UPI001885DA2B|nr:cyclic AMP-responsive element-binding protein 3-like protein 4 [Syngnathus acus]